MLNNYQKFFISTFAIFAVLFLILPVLILAADASVSCDQQYPWCKDETTNIADLVGKFYNYALAAVGVAALGAIIFGGVKYTVSAGNPSGQSDAISWITGAVWGLVLLLGANLLLRTINPELTSLKLGGLKSVEIKSTSTISDKEKIPRNGICVSDEDCSSGKCLKMILSDEKSNGACQ